jgi:hypothetical protein
MNLISQVYCEWVEDLGLSPEDILMVLLEKKDQEIEYLRKRLAKYEN